MDISKIFLEKYYKDKDNYTFCFTANGENPKSFYVMIKALKDVTNEELIDLKRRYDNDNFLHDNDIFNSSFAYREIINDQIYLRRIKKLNKIKERICL